MNKYNKNKKNREFYFDKYNQTLMTKKSLKKKIYKRKKNLKKKIRRFNKLKSY
jgi:hypothetical protein